VATTEVFVLAYERLGYVVCDRGDLEQGYEKIAIFAEPDGTPTHAARQLPTGAWTSKLGRLEDIEHNDLRGVAGGSYGDVAVIMRREEQAGS
jgi:hypothetical protein